MPVTTYGDISPRTAGFAVRRLLDRGQYLMVTERFGQVDPQGKNKTKTRKYRRYLSLQRATAPLAEGIPPSGQQLTYEDITLTLQQYGDLVKITDVVKDTHEDDVLMETMDLCGEQAGETVESLRIAFLKAGTNAFLANSVADREHVTSPATRSDLRKIYRFFKKNKAREISQIVSASGKISTEPIGRAYFAMGHTDLDADLRGITGFVPVEKYSDSTKAMEGEIGKVENIRFILSPMFEPWLAAGTSATGTTYLSNGVKPGSSAAPDVYPLIVVARDAYAIVPLQGFNSITPAVLNPGKPSKSDPLGQIGFVSWKTWQGGVILNQSWMCRLEVAVTANPT